MNRIKGSLIFMYKNISRFLKASMLININGYLGGRNKWIKNENQIKEKIRQDK